MHTPMHQVHTLGFCAEPVPLCLLFLCRWVWFLHRCIIRQRHSGALHWWNCGRSNWLRLSRHNTHLVLLAIGWWCPHSGRALSILVVLFLFFQDWWLCHLCEGVLTWSCTCTLRLSLREVDCPGMNPGALFVCCCSVAHAWLTNFWPAACTLTGNGRMAMVRLLSFEHVL